MPNYIQNAIIVLAILFAPFGKSQQRSAYRSNGQPIEGTIYPIDDLGSYPTSLADLVKRSTLIIEGFVDSSSLPSRLGDRKDPFSICTDIVISVKKVYKGSLDRKTSPQVVVEQMGGAIGRLRIVHRQDDPLTQGTRHILFLSRDTRAGLPRVAGIPRYLVTGAWIGKFRLENGKLSASKNAAPGITAFNRTDENSFVTAVAREVAHQAKAGVQ